MKIAFYLKAVLPMGSAAFLLVKTLIDNLGNLVENRAYRIGSCPHNNVMRESILYNRLLCEKTMKKYMLLFLLFFSTSAFSKDPMCWVKYDFKNNKAPLGIPPGQGSPINLELTPEEIVYASCKHKCYGFIPDHEEVIGIKSCTLDEIPIDKTKYFNIYKSSINRICKVQVIGKYSHNLYITNSDSECKKEMESFIWCKMQENSCTYTYGQEPYK